MLYQASLNLNDFFIFFSKTFKLTLFTNPTDFFYFFLRADSTSALSESILLLLLKALGIKVNSIYFDWAFSFGITMLL